GISEVLAGSTRTRMQPSYAIKTVHRRERAEDNRQEQLCVPLVASGTYWYYSDSRVIPMPALSRAWGSCDLR
ncbi:MAG: hypothetical protein ACLQFX_11990, partial [Acidimicrobiales bacterium]